jgi:hypothetical protein
MIVLPIDMKDLHEKTPQREYGKINQQVHANSNMRNLGIKSSLEPLKITTHFISLPIGNFYKQQP